MAIPLHGSVARFVEARTGRANAFALCDTVAPVLAPVSRPGHQNVRGVRCILAARGSTSYALEVKFAAIPDPVTRILVGLYLPPQMDFAAADYRLRVLVPGRGIDSVVSTSIQAAGRNKRWAILGSIARKPILWEYQPADRPELFANQEELGTAHLVPRWWLPPPNRGRGR